MHARVRRSIACAWLTVLPKGVAEGTVRVPGSARLGSLSFCAPLARGWRGIGCLVEGSRAAAATVPAIPSPAAVGLRLHGRGRRRTHAPACPALVHGRQQEFVSGHVLGALPVGETLALPSGPALCFLGPGQNQNWRPQINKTFQLVYISCKVYFDAL